MIKGPMMKDITSAVIAEIAVLNVRYSNKLKKLIWVLNFNKNSESIFIQKPQLLLFPFPFL